MSTPEPASKWTAEERSHDTFGSSSEAILRLVGRVICERHPQGGTLLDVGCGNGDLWRHARTHCARYIGADVVRYDRFPSDAEFLKVDVDSGRIPLPDGAADVVAAVETIEHLENPRAFFRELVRLARPGGLVVVTTPNQLSLLSKLTLLAKGYFNAFAERPGLYPSHITALLEIDLLRIARECGLIKAQVRYTDAGRIPGTGRRWPAWFTGRAFSDNLLVSARPP